MYMCPVLTVADRVDNKLISYVLPQQNADCFQVFMLIGGRQVAS